MAHLLSLIRVAVAEKNRVCAERSDNKTIDADKTVEALCQINGTRVVRRKRTLRRVLTVGGSRDGAVFLPSQRSMSQKNLPTQRSGSGEVDPTVASTESEDVEEAIGKQRRDIDAVAEALKETVLQEVYRRFKCWPATFGRRVRRSSSLAAALPSVDEQDDVDVCSSTVSMPELTPSVRQPSEFRWSISGCCVLKDRPGNQEQDRRSLAAAAAAANALVGDDLQQSSTLQQSDGEGIYNDTFRQNSLNGYQSATESAVNPANKTNPQHVSTISSNNQCTSAPREAWGYSMKARNRRKLWLCSTKRAANWKAFDEDITPSDVDSPLATETSATIQYVAFTGSDDNRIWTPATPHYERDVTGHSGLSRDPTTVSAMKMAKPSAVDHWTQVTELDIKQEHVSSVASLPRQDRDMVDGSPKQTLSDCGGGTLVTAINRDFVLRTGDAYDGQHPGWMEWKASPGRARESDRVKRNTIHERRRNLAFKPIRAIKRTTKCQKCSNCRVTSCGKLGLQRSASVDMLCRKRRRHIATTTDDRTTAEYRTTHTTHGKDAWSCPANTRTVSLDACRTDAVNETTDICHEKRNSGTVAFLQAPDATDYCSALTQHDIRAATDRPDQFEVFGAGLHHGYVEAKNIFQVPVTFSFWRFLQLLPPPRPRQTPPHGSL